MSSNLPPGVTDQMIEDFASRESLLEAFERHLNQQEGGKTQKDEEALYIIYNEPLEYIEGQIYYVSDFVERAMTWAYEQGRDDASADRRYTG